MAEIEDVLERLPGHRQNLLEILSDHWSLAALGQAELDAMDDVPPQLADPAAVLAAELARSEEHTSELQSLMRISYAVFCLKKKKTIHKKPKSKIQLKHKTKAINECTR